MKTVLQNVIQWTIENAINIESQDGTNYIAIDHEEMRTKFEQWLEEEKSQIVRAYNLSGQRKFVDGNHYYVKTFNEQ